jgi:hypothetical protein
MGVVGRGEKADGPNIRVASRFELPPDCIGTANGRISRFHRSDENSLRKIDVSIVLQIPGDNVAMHLLTIHDAIASIALYTHVNNLQMVASRAALQRFPRPNNGIAVTTAQGNERGNTRSDAKPTQLPTTASASRRTVCA